MRDLMTGLTVFGAAAFLTACGAATMPAQFFVNQAGDGTDFFVGGGLYDGTSVVCLEVDNPDSVSLEDGAWVIEGRAVSDRANTDGLLGNLIACTEPPMRVLQVRDDRGNQWLLGYSWTSEDGWDRTPSIGIHSGEAVQLTVRADLESEAAGFVVTENGNLLYAMESGKGGQGLEASDLEDMTVSAGDLVTTTTGDCGEERTYMSLDFTSDSDRERLGPNGDGTLIVDGDYYTVCNITSYTVSETADGCSLDGETSWMMFR
jgi:hypothetical protein